MPRPLGLTTALLTAGGLLLAGGVANAAGSAGHGTPVIETPPAHAPHMVSGKGGCTLPSPSDSTSPTAGAEQLLWVRSHPTGMVTVWISGLNAKKCVARRTTEGAAVAGSVAKAIRRTKAFPTEPLPCPFDDNTAVRVYFTYASGGDEYADVSLSGCRPISAADRASRWGNTAGLAHALRPAAPAAWRNYLEA